MASSIELNDILNSIKAIKGNDLPIKFYNSSGDLEFSLNSTIDSANSKLNKSIYEFSVYCDFISYADLQTIFLNINEIYNLLLKLSNTSDENFEKINDLSKKILENISRLPDINDLSFVPNTHLSHASLLHLFNLVNFKIQAFTETDINYVLKYANIAELEEISKILISIHNARDNSQVVAQEVVNAQKAFQSIIDKAYKLEVAVAVQDLEEKAVEIKESIGLNSNELLIDVFKNAAGTDDKKILAYNIFIFAIFILTLFSLTYLIHLTLFTNTFKPPLTFHFYGFYISFFLFLSGLLTYLIKERKRLLNHKHYCTITHLELSALPMYTGQINDKNKRDDLIFHLGDRYFKGPNPSISTDDITSNMTTSKLSEVIKLVQEVKTTLK
ncbi:hypothetical protein KTH66_06250 [Acinetobacter baumannii]|nr:hypothetical protein [Acinetobacter baumannii]